MVNTSPLFSFLVENQYGLSLFFCSRNGIIIKASKSGGVIQKFMLTYLFYKISRVMFIERLLLITLSSRIVITSGLVS